MTVKDELILTLMKLRLGSLNADLAVCFQISETNVSQVINTWVRFLAKELKCLIYNPLKDIALQHLPKKFNNAKYRSVKHIIDCTEMFIETSKDPKVKAATWSDYKHHHHTLKVLVSIMPCGSFNLISELGVLEHQMLLLLETRVSMTFLNMGMRSWQTKGSPLQRIF